MAYVKDSAQTDQGLKTLSQCLLEQNLVPCPQQKQQWQRDNCAYRHRSEPNLEEEWFGHRVYVGVYKTDRGLTARIIPTNGYNEVAAMTAKELANCATRLQPDIGLQLKPVTEYFPDVR